MQHIPNPGNKKVEGILLYPDVGDTIHATYSWNDQHLRFKTVNLNKSWRNIESELLDLIGLVQKNAE